MENIMFLYSVVLFIQVNFVEFILCSCTFFALFQFSAFEYLLRLFGSLDSLLLKYLWFFIFDVLFSSNLSKESYVLVLLSSLFQVFIFLSLFGLSFSNHYYFVLYFSSFFYLIILFHISVYLILIKFLNLPILTFAFTVFFHSIIFYIRILQSILYYSI